MIFAWLSQSAPLFPSAPISKACWFVSHHVPSFLQISTRNPLTFPLCHLTAQTNPNPTDPQTCSHFSSALQPSEHPSTSSFLNPPSLHTPAHFLCSLSGPYLAACFMLCFPVSACFTRVFYLLLVYWTLDFSLRLHVLEYSHLLVNLCTSIFL